MIIGVLVASRKDRESNMTEKAYKFGESKLILRFGDITTTFSDVIVSSDDYYLSMGGGVSASILKAGGNEIALDAAKKVPAELGDVIVTTAGRLKSLFIFHAITIGKIIGKTEPKTVVKSTTIKSLELLNSLNLNSISFPALGSGAAGFSYEEVAVEMAEVISDYLTRINTEQEVIIYLFDKYGRMKPTDYIIFFEAFATKAPQIAEKEITKKKEIEISKPNINNVALETEQDIKAKRLHHLRKILGLLEDQRNRLEEKLIEHLENSDGEDYKKIAAKLKENEKFRLSRLKELKDLSTDGISQKVKSGAKSVFVSSTYKDLVNYRKAVKEQISKRKMVFIGMEHFGANPDNHPPASVIIEEVRKADIYIGIFGVRYGYIDQATGLSMTELEYQEAKSLNMPMLLYVIKDSANVRVSDIETNDRGREKLKELKEEILTNKVIYKFDTIVDLEKQVYADLEKLQ